MIIKYATLPKRLVRASSLYNKEELIARGLQDKDKLLEDGNTDKKTEQAWKQNTKSLLTATSFEDIIAIEDKTVAIVHGLCDPPLITIDIDSKHKTDLLMPIVNNLPKHQQPLVVSEGVGKAGFHLLYHNTPDNKLLLDYILAIHGGGLGDDLDVLQSSDRVLFIGNRGNLTKRHVALNPLEEGEVTRPIPIPLQLAVMALFKDSRPKHIDMAKESGTFLPEHTSQISDLGFMFQGFNPRDSKADLILATFIAKRAKADLKAGFNNQPDDEQYIYHPKYYTQKPNDLLLRLSGSLKNDVGIDPQQHKLIVEAINDLLPHSKNYLDLQKEIIVPDTKEPYNYNPKWMENTSSVYSMGKQVLNIYRVSKHTSPLPHMVHNTETGEIRLFRTPGELVEELAGEVPLTVKNLKMIQTRAVLVDLLERPDSPFGLIPPDKDSTHRRSSFNIYRRSKIQEMFYEPQETSKLIKHIYSFPSTIIGAIESQMGTEKTHSLFLPFIKHKLLTHEPSPLIFALMGPPHSFKTGLVEGILRTLFSSERYIKTNGDVATEKYNEWLINTDILLIDEIHHLHGTPLLKPVIQMLNKFGAEYHENIRRMYSSVSKAEEVAQEVTPFITMNKVVVPASETVGERRLVVGYSTKPVRDTLKLSDPDIKSAINREMLDFAYYLATEVKDIDPVDYGNNRRWKEVDNHYFKFMKEGISKLKQLAMALGMTNDKVNIKALQELIYPHNLSDCVVKLQRTSHGTPYRLRLWNAEGNFNAKIPGIVDFIDDIDPLDVDKALINNENVLKPSIVGGGINQMKQDMIIHLDLLQEFNLVDSFGNPLYESEELLQDVPTSQSI